jgi:Helix-turn-helix domain
VGDASGDQPVAVVDPAVWQPVTAASAGGAEAVAVAVCRWSNARRSRGLAGREFLRSIARRLGRSPSTISRKVNDNGAARGYRACRADGDALRRARPPKRAKLAQRERFRRVVEDKLDETSR